MATFYMAVRYTQLWGMAIFEHIKALKVFCFHVMRYINLRFIFTFTQTFHKVMQRRIGGMVGCFTTGHVVVVNY